VQPWTTGHRWQSDQPAKQLHPNQLQRHVCPACANSAPSVATAPMPKPATLTRTSRAGLSDGAATDDSERIPTRLELTCSCCGRCAAAAGTEDWLCKTGHPALCERIIAAPPAVMSADPWTRSGSARFTSSPAWFHTSTAFCAAAEQTNCTRHNCVLSSTLTLLAAPEAFQAMPRPHRRPLFVGYRSGGGGWRRRARDDRRDEAGGGGGERQEQVLRVQRKTFWHRFHCRCGSTAQNSRARSRCSSCSRSGHGSGGMCSSTCLACAPLRLRARGFLRAFLSEETFQSLHPLTRLFQLALALALS